MPVGFLFPGSKTNVQSFKELLDILTEVSVYSKKQNKNNTIEINAEDFKSPN